MPELHGRCRTVCPNNRKLKSNLFSPLNFLNRSNIYQIKAFLSVTSDFLDFFFLSGKSVVADPPPLSGIFHYFFNPSLSSQQMRGNENNPG